MVLYYGLLALETANNTVTSMAAASERRSVSRKSIPLQNSIGRMSSSSNSWIYTEDLRKRFEERYADYRYIFVPVYINGKDSRHNRSTTEIIPQTSDSENSWMYSRSIRDHLFYSTSRISSSACCVTNPGGYMRDQLPVKKSSKTRFFKRPSASPSSKTRSTTSLSSKKFHPHSSSFSTHNLIKPRTNVVVVQEEDDEENENHAVPLIKQE